MMLKPFAAVMALFLLSTGASAQTDVERPLFVLAGCAAADTTKAMILDRATREEGIKQELVEELSEGRDKLQARARLMVTTSVQYINEHKQAIEDPEALRRSLQKAFMDTMTLLSEVLKEDEKTGLLMLTKTNKTCESAFNNMLVELRQGT